MIGVRQCRACGEEMAVAGSQGHLRCPHCRCWLPTSESWTPIWFVLGVTGLVTYAVWHLW